MKNFFKSISAFFVFFIVTISVTFAAPPTGSRKGNLSNVPVRKWSKWDLGFDLGLHGLGKFGRDISINAPPGSFYVKGAGHIWFRHFILLQAHMATGINHTRFMYGAGIKLNLIEMAFISDLLPGAQRGLLAPFLGNFMILGGFNMNRYFFEPPSPSSGGNYQTASWAPEYGLGAQWYFVIKDTFAKRYYVETTLHYTSIQLNRYLAPYFGIGFELE